MTNLVTGLGCQDAGIVEAETGSWWTLETWVEMAWDGLVEAAEVPWEPLEEAVQVEADCCETEAACYR